MARTLGRFAVKQKDSSNWTGPYLTTKNAESAAKNLAAFYRGTREYEVWSGKCDKTGAFVPETLLSTHSLTLAFKKVN